MGCYVSSVIRFFSLRPCFLLMKLNSFSMVSTFSFCLYNYSMHEQSKKSARNFIATLYKNGPRLLGHTVSNMFEKLVHFHMHVL